MKTHAQHHRSRLQRLLVPGGLVIALVTGLWAGNWLSDHNARARVTQLWQHWGRKFTDPAISTELYSLEVTRVKLESFQGYGGALAAFGDDVVFASPKGRLGVLRGDWRIQYAPERVPMNAAALERSEDKGEDFTMDRFRVMDILLRDPQDRESELLVSHHYYAGDRCIEMRVSAARIVLEEDGPRLAAPWRTVYSVRPCIRIGADGFFEGHESGGRLLWDGGSHVLMTVGHYGFMQGKRGARPPMDPAQDIGKLLRIDLAAGTAEQVATGLRNAQGLARDREGQVWWSEHGPRGGDELNRLVPGANYGWPEVTYGTDYGPADWPYNPVQGAHEGYEKPVYAWVPSVATSAIVFIDGAEFPLWQDDLLIGSLRARSLFRARLVDARLVYVEPIALGRRVRDLTLLPDGRFAALTDDACLLFFSRAAD